MLSSAVRLKVFYDLDTPVTLARVQAGEWVPYIGPRGLRDYDLVLSYTGGRALSELQTRLGAGQVAPLYGSVDPRAHRPVPPVDAFRADLSYLGTYAADRQGILEQLFIEPARRLPDRKFLIGGALYPREFPWTATSTSSARCSGGSSRVLLLSPMTRNVPARPWPTGVRPSGRLFEAAACGTAILSERGRLDAFFELRREVLIAATPNRDEALQMGPEESPPSARRGRRCRRTHADCRVARPGAGLAIGSDRATLAAGSAR